MNKNLKILISLITTAILVLLAVIYLNVDDDNIAKSNTKTVNKPNPSNNKTTDKTTVTPLLVNQIPVVPMTSFIEEFNANVAIDLSLSDDNAKHQEVGVLSVKFREDSDDVVAKIKEYMGDVAQNQIQIESLVGRCYRLNKNIKNMQKGINGNNSEQNRMEILFNEYYFYLGLQESKFCDTLGTKQDPFWKYLALARKGDELAQLLLLDNIILAVQKSRKVINIQKDPIKYMNLRDEAIMYLHKLAARGVHRASEKLGRLYSGHDWDVVPQNPVLAYYYFYLANKQDGFEPIPYDMNLNRFYDKLSEKQKSTVDRMTENL